jgi:hypothetical protein
MLDMYWTEIEIIWKGDDDDDDQDDNDENDTSNSKSTVGDEDVFEIEEEPNFDDMEPDEEELMSIDEEIDVDAIDEDDLAHIDKQFPNDEYVDVLDEEDVQSISEDDEVEDEPYDDITNY